MHKTIPFDSVRKVLAARQETQRKQEAAGTAHHAVVGSASQSIRAANVKLQELAELRVQIAHDRELDALRTFFEEWCRSVGVDADTDPDRNEAALRASLSLVRAAS